MTAHRDIWTVLLLTGPVTGQRDMTNHRVLHMFFVRDK